MRFIDRFGNEYRSDTKVGLLYELYKSSWNFVYCVDIDEWIAKAATRIWEQFDIRIEYKTYEEFVDELITNEIIKEIN